MATSATTISANEINKALDGLKDINNELYGINELMEKYVNSESSLQKAIQKRLDIEATHKKKIAEINAKKISAEEKYKELLKEETRYENQKINHQKKHALLLLHNTHVLSRFFLVRGLPLGCL